VAVPDFKRGPDFLTYEEPAQRGPKKKGTILDKSLPGLYHKVSEHCFALRKGQRTPTRMNVPIFLAWKNFLDIFVISFILHRLFLLMRGTVAFQVSIGLVVLWLFQEVANAAGLVLTSWFFRGIGAVAVLVIVVVFRNELREILVHTNPIRFLLGRTRQTREVGYHLLAQAAFRLGNRRIGALIVIQNEDDLRGDVRGGLPFDANLLPELLESIFSKESPVHDGAVIIRGNRIDQAGTFLPLSQEETLPQHFGTRHRAAIGLSEVCDAVILVVSEERGDVSLVHRRNVERIHNPDQMEQRLDFLLTQREALEGNLHKAGRAWMTHAGGLLLMFVLVSAFWGLYAGREFSLISVRAPVYYRDIPAGLQMKQTSAEEVEVQVSGRRGLVSSLDPQQVRAFLSLGQVGAGEHELVLKSENILLAPGLEVERITPSAITVEMERILDKNVRVKADLKGPPPDGFEVDVVGLKPDYVRIRGPATILEDVTVMQTRTIDLQSLRVRDGQASQDVPLKIDTPSIELPELERRQVQVTIRFRPVEAKREEGATRTHTVQKGDTLYEIGKEYGVPIEAVRRLNNLKPGEYLQPGQELKIPPS
jgi:diadenylate cyclase